MDRRGLVLSFAAAVALGAVGCASPSEPGPAADVVAAVASPAELADAIRAAGAHVVATGDTVVSIFSVPGVVLLVDGVRVEAFGFADAEQAAADVPNLARALVLWATPMRLYRSGSVLLLAPGEPDSLDRVLTRVLGRPAASVG